MRPDGTGGCQGLSRRLDEPPLLRPARGSSACGDGALKSPRRLPADGKGECRRHQLEDHRPVFELARSLATAVATIRRWSWRIASPAAGFSGSRQWPSITASRTQTRLIEQFVALQHALFVPGENRQGRRRGVLVNDAAPRPAFRRRTPSEQAPAGWSGRVSRDVETPVFPGQIAVPVAPMRAPASAQPLVVLGVGARQRQVATGHHVLAFLAGQTLAPHGRRRCRAARYRPSLSAVRFSTRARRLASKVRWRAGSKGPKGRLSRASPSASLTARMRGLRLTTATITALSPISTVTGCASPGMLHVLQGQDERSIAVGIRTAADGSHCGDERTLAGQRPVADFHEPRIRRRIGRGKPEALRERVVVLVRFDGECGDQRAAGERETPIQQCMSIGRVRSHWRAKSMIR